MHCCPAILRLLRKRGKPANRELFFYILSLYFTSLYSGNGDAAIPNPVKKPDTPDGTSDFNPDGTPVVRVRLPKKKFNEQFACAELMMGANHIRVRCHDGVERMGRIKGKIKKRAWIREGDILIVVP